jgi:predicted ArsR family transcriptional regulator
MGLNNIPGREVAMHAGLQLEARALGDATRYRLFRYIVEAAGPVGIGELTAHVRLNHNAVRQHLAVLKEAGLVTEETEQRERPGRPRLLYRQHPEVAERWDVPGSYAWLAGLLSAAIRRGQEPRQAGRQDGHRRAAEISGPGDLADLMEQELTRRGFRPARAEQARQLEFTLGRCPFAEVAAADPGTVCQLHLGLAEGLTEGLGQLQVEALTPRDPFEGGCRLTVRRTAVGPAEDTATGPEPQGQENNGG